MKIPGDYKKKKITSDSLPKKSEVKNTAEARKNAEDSSVKITVMGRSLTESETTARQSRIAKIKSQIEDGSYKVDSKILAKSLVDTISEEIEFEKSA